MVKVGRAEYPQLTLSEATQAIKKFDERGVRLRDLRYDAKDLLVYGLLREDGERAVPTPRAARLREGKDDAENAATLLEMALDVPLFRVLDEIFRELDFPETAFADTVRLLTRAGPEELKTHVVTIRSHMKEIAELRNKAGIPDGPARFDPKVRPPGLTAAPSRRASNASSAIELNAPGVNQRFPFTPQGVEQLLRILTDGEFVEFLRSLAEANSLQFTRTDDRWSTDKSRKEDAPKE
jgi:hypothetical protein